MGLIGWLKGAIRKMFTADAKTKFGVEPIISSEMDAAINQWMAIYRGMPGWAKEDEEIKTINFAKSVCSETARLVTLAIGISVSGSARATFLQSQVDKMLYPRLRGWVEYGCAGGTVILKPNRNGIDVVTPDHFMVTEYDSNKRITGAIFQDGYTVGKRHYTKLEYHRYTKAIGEDGEEVVNYQITSKAFVSESAHDIGREISLDSTKWAGIAPEVSIAKKNDERIDSMLFGVFTMPDANNIDIDSPLGMSIFAGCLEELRDLDIAYSRNATEIEDSQTIELLDDAMMMGDGAKMGSRKVKLPRHVHNVFGNGTENFYQQILRPIQTTERKVGINQQLSFIGYKCGYSDGYFVFDQKTGMATATQVEADDRRTIQLIKDIRDNLQAAITDTIYALSVFADLYELAPVGSYTVDFDFGDITYNEDEDRMRNYQLMQQGIIPKWYYLTKFEGMGEDEAKALIEEAQGAAAEREALFAQAAGGT